MAGLQQWETGRGREANQQNWRLCACVSQRVCEKASEAPQTHLCAAGQRSVKRVASRSIASGASHPHQSFKADQLHSGYLPPQGRGVALVLGARAHILLRRAAPTAIGMCGTGMSAP